MAPLLILPLWGFTWVGWLSLRSSFGRAGNHD